MIFHDLIPYLLDPDRLESLYEPYTLNKEAEYILVYAIEDLTLDAEIVFFDPEETDDYLTFEKDGVKYVQFFSIDHAIDLLDQLELRGKPIKQIAKRLLKYRIYDA
ncbi:hypothetical protein [Siphonobacter curvatus]|uniref:Uncharacterized protein n=1 Tax=Siphonobacter curvatus TaxID=2094562 RepID=A0A2S7IJJ7_9BACT|nr:hypothetical protein [Siphonobacter curvatus]PQA56755.1 hypothetical protein C5O19_15550 [Siphonobacter curvatus]